jgi:hypothetical protein
MATGNLGAIRKRVRQADRLLFEMTGTHLRTVVKKGISMAGEALSRQVFEDSAALGPMYHILGVAPSAPDLVVKAAFRALSREYHTDTGIHPDSGKFQQVVEAYRDIMLARLSADGGDVPPEDNGDDGTGKPPA